jgi:hypothetical protein
MDFYYDAEFLEDGQRVYPISIGVTTGDGDEYHAVYGEWMLDGLVIAKVRNHRWLMQNVVPHLPQAAQEIVHGRAGIPETGRFLSHPVVHPRWSIALQLEAFIGSYGNDRNEHRLWAYYGAYDHLVLCQTFGTMMQLPRCVPMFTCDLMQLEDEVNRARARMQLAPVERPRKVDEHHALADARWNLAFRRALLEGDPRIVPSEAGDTRLAWTIDEDRDLVTIPSRVFVAGYERLEPVGPNKGLEDGDKAPARRLWETLF